MILRDPIHGLITFEGVAEKVIAPLLGTPEVQRLRRIRQLGMASIVFPGAEHTRFAHALGAAHVMVRLAERIRNVQSQVLGAPALDEEAFCDALAAAFLHDLGHGPMSHLFEEVLPYARSHELWTHEFIRDSSTHVHRVLANIDPQMPERVAALLSGKHRLSYLARAVSGTLDVDRCDYLLRDSHMTGVRYGLYDLDWLLRSFTLGNIEGEPVLAVEGRKGLPPLEGFFLARHFMYSQVYHHKATRAAECLIRAIFVRVAELVKDGIALAPLPCALRNTILGQPVSMGDYWELDDHVLWYCFAEWEKHSDAILSEFTRNLRQRVLPKTMPIPDENPEIAQTVFALAKEVVQKRGLRADLTVWLDVASDMPYAEPQGQNPEGIWVALRHGPMRRLGDLSFVLGELRNKQIERTRLVFPGELRDSVLRAVEGVVAT